MAILFPIAKIGKEQIILVVIVVFGRFDLFSPIFLQAHIAHLLLPDFYYCYLVRILDAHSTLELTTTMAGPTANSRPMPIEILT